MAAEGRAKIKAWLWLAAIWCHVVSIGRLPVVDA
jgi:hypothetical protein